MMILVADDDVLSRRLLVATLERAGYGRLPAAYLRRCVRTTLWDDMEGKNSSSC